MPRFFEDAASCFPGNGLRRHVLRKCRPINNLRNLDFRLVSSLVSGRCFFSCAVCPMIGHGDLQYRPGVVERLWRSVKGKEVDLTEYEDLADARRHLGRFLDDVYTTKRIYSALGYVTPAEFEQQWIDMQQYRPQVGS